MEATIERKILRITLSDRSAGDENDAVSLRTDNYQIRHMENGDVVIRVNDNRGSVSLYLHDLKALPTAESIQWQRDDLENAALEIRGFSDVNVEKVTQQGIDRINDRADEILTILKSREGSVHE